MRYGLDENGNDRVDLDELEEVCKKVNVAATIPAVPYALLVLTIDMLSMRVFRMLPNSSSNSQ